MLMLWLNAVLEGLGCGMFMCLIELEFDRSLLYDSVFHGFSVVF